MLDFLSMAMQEPRLLAMAIATMYNTHIHTHTLRSGLWVRRFLFSGTVVSNGPPVRFTIFNMPYAAANKAICIEAGQRRTAANRNYHCCCKEGSFQHCKSVRLD